MGMSPLSAHDVDDDVLIRCWFECQPHHEPERAALGVSSAMTRRNPQNGFQPVTAQETGTPVGVPVTLSLCSKLQAKFISQHRHQRHR